MKTMKLSDIRIKDSYTATTPRKEKMKECRDFWNENHKQDRYIVVNHDGVLVDGYIQYLILKENGIADAFVKTASKKVDAWHRIYRPAINTYKCKPTTYIYGIHPDSKNIKELVWRVPNSWVGWENDILPGDKILVKTKRGLAPIIVTKIKWLDKCPVDMPVRKVARKL